MNIFNFKAKVKYNYKGKFCTSNNNYKNQLYLSLLNVISSTKIAYLLYVITWLYMITKFNWNYFKKLVSAIIRYIINNRILNKNLQKIDLWSISKWKSLITYPHILIKGKALNWY